MADLAAPTTGVRVDLPEPGASAEPLGDRRANPANVSRALDRRHEVVDRNPPPVVLGEDGRSRGPA